MIRVFCDFDGTVCLQDVGQQFFREFAGEKAEASVQRLLGGKITTQMWFMELCNAIPSITCGDLLKYVDQFSIDPHFSEFARFCTDRDISVTILTDGLDVYVERVLSNGGVGHVPFFANHAEFIEERLKASFPYADAECSLCGSCKRNHMLNASADEDIIVYIGDGYSDRCPIRYADFVFAKRHLIKYCQQQNITFFEFNDFNDVQVKLTEILKRKRIRCRQEAAMARREVFMQG